MGTRYTTRAVLLAVALATSMTAAGGGNLLPNPEFRTAGDGAPAGWSTWSPLPSLAPAAAVESGAEGNCLRLQAREFASFGKWVSSGAAVQAGRYYRFEVLYSPERIANEPASVGVLLTWNAADGRPVQRDYVDEVTPAGGAWRRAARVIAAPEKAAAVVVELWLRWSEAGSVRFRGPSLVEAPAPAARRVRVVTTRIPAAAGATLAGNLQYMADVLDRAGREKPDIVLLTENFVDRGIPGPPHASAQPVPGPATAVLAEKARQYRSYVVTSLLESDGGHIYITAVLIDRQGRLAGKYRKTHLPLAEAEDGVTPGGDYPVFQTDFGRIGLMVCWDTWFPEPARILRLHGAEMLLVPLAGDGAARHWDVITRARALDNGVYLVASSGNGSSSRIVDPDGEVVSEATDGLAAADVDLARESRVYWLSVGPANGEARSLYIKERRPETYAPLTGEPR